MEIAVHEFQHLLLIRTDVGTEGTVAIRTEFLDDAINHSRTENIVLLKGGTLALDAIGRSLATVWQASQ